MACIDSSYIPYQDDVNFDLSYSNSPIIQIGNYFIVDSGTVTSSPYQEFTGRDATSLAARKCPATEKLTSRTCTIYGNQLTIASSRYEREKLKTFKQLGDRCSKLRQEVKILELDRQKNNMEVRKRLQPGKDFRFDVTRIVSLEKRLGVNMSSCYLDKRMRYTTRTRPGNNVTITQTIRKARSNLKLWSSEKSLGETAGIRSANTKNASSPISTSLRILSTFSNQGELRYAPANVHSGKAKHNYEDSNARAISSATSISTNHKHSLFRQGKQSLHQTQSIFGALCHTNPAAMNESIKSFTSFVDEVINSSTTSGFPDDNDTRLPDQVDLSDYFLQVHTNRNKNPNNSTSSANNQHRASSHQLPTGKPEIPACRLTTDTIKMEAHTVNVKVQNFLKDLALSQREDSNLYRTSPSLPIIPQTTLINSEDGKIKITLFQPLSLINKDTRIQPMLPQPLSLSNKDTRIEPILSQQQHLSNKDIRIESISSQPLRLSPEDDRTEPTLSESLLFSTEDTRIKRASMEIQLSSVNNSRAKSITTADNSHVINKDSTATEATKSAGQVETDMVDEVHECQEAGRNIKYSWKLIPARPVERHAKESHTIEDLVLQSLTGIPIRDIINSPVPLNTAARAMRHTSTFKMHKIVEKLAHERTRYQTHQMEELKRDVDGEDEQFVHEPEG